MKKTHMAKLMLFTLIGTTLMVSVFLGCSLFSSDTGTINLSLTDAPITDAADVEGVFITIDSIAYNLNGAWVEDTSFSAPQKFNLLDLTNGTVAPLANTHIGAGEVTQIRFMLAVSDEDAEESSDPSCYILIDPQGTADGVDSEDIKHELFIPSGEQSGYKATGSFTVPVNGTVEITADFDVRKSVKKTGADSYKLQPTIRLVVNNQAGSIAGAFISDISDLYTEYVIFAYADDTYDASEKDSDFPNAISSTAPTDTDDNGTLDEYLIPFLAVETYDLVIVGVSDDGTYTTIDDTTYIDIVTTASEETTQDIDLTPSEE